MNTVLKIQKISTTILISNFLLLFGSVLLNIINTKIENLMVVFSLSFVISLLFYFLLLAVVNFKN